LYFAIAYSVQCGITKTKMSERLIKLVNDTKTRDGIIALAKKAGVSRGTVINVSNGRTPHPKNAFKLAKACGCGEEEALSIAYECSPQEANRRTA